METPEEIAAREASEKAAADAAASAAAAAADPGAASGSSNDGASGASGSGDDDDDDIGDDELDGKVPQVSFVETKSSAAQSGSGQQAATSEEELERLRDIEQKYSALVSDPLIEAASAFRAAGGSDVLKFVEEITSGYVDVSSMSADEIYERNYRTKIAPKHKLSEEDIKEALDEFRSLRPSQKASIVDPIRDQMEADQKTSLEKARNKFAKEAESSRLSEKEFMEREKAAVLTLKQKLNSLVGKTYHRIPVTEEIAREIEELAGQIAIRNPKTLEADVESTISMWMWLRYGDKILKQHIKYGQNRGLEQGVIGRAGNGKSPIKTSSSQATSGVRDKYQETIRMNGGKLPRQGEPKP